ncbi:YjbQ family protein [Candidatus Woesearchaeota archaeon]|nr:YjbQ family protein [Candidatus Woesearchaeota archaeon]
MISDKFSVSSKKRESYLDITSSINKIIRKHNLGEGVCMVFVPHATAAITINENYDPNILADFDSLLKKLVPRGAGYLHDRIDGNADSHLKAAVIGPSEFIPVSQGKLALGTWQSVLLCDFDGPRTREVVVRVF